MFFAEIGKLDIHDLKSCSLEKHRENINRSAVTEGETRFFFKILFKFNIALECIELNLNDEDLQSLNEILACSGEVHKHVQFPEGSMQIESNEHTSIVIIKKALMYFDAPKLDLTQKRPVLCQQGNRPSASFSKIVSFEPLSKIQQMLDAIEKKVIDFELNNANADSKFGFWVSKFGFYEWYVPKACAKYALTSEGLINRNDLQGMLLVFQNPEKCKSFNFLYDTYKIQEPIDVNSFNPGELIEGTCLVKKPQLDDETESDAD